MTSSPLRIGVIGVGFGTTVHVPGFQSEWMQVVALCSRRRERVEKAARDLGIPGVYTDYRRMLEEADLDAVSIATPPVSHYEMTMAALDAGKHVMCEKPFAMDEGQAREMWHKARDTGLTAMIAHEFRFAPARAYVKELLELGYVGDLRTIHTTLFRGPTQAPEPRPMVWGSQAPQGGGFLGALGSHYIDCLRDWSGEISRVCGGVFIHDPDRIDRESGQTGLADADEAFSFLVTFENGGWGSMSANSVAPFGRGARIEVYGTQGTLQTPQPGFNPPPDGVVLGARFGDDPEIRELPMPQRLRPFDDSRDERLMAFRILVRRFLQGIAEGTSPTPNFYDGFRCQQVLDAVRQSGESGRWVDIPVE
ncbi:MAG: Gfo/Idh/MocA family oxidoreductase [Dehalococcoidia bacterium]